MTKLDPRLHFVVVTGILVKDGKFLIMKRSEREVASPGKWTVPGGKVVYDEYSQLPYQSSHPQWYHAVEWVLRKEIREEANLEIKKPQYLCDVIFMRPDGFPTVILSYWAEYESGEVKLGKDLTDFAWVTVEEAKNYDLIEGIWDEIRQVDEILKNQR